MKNPFAASLFLVLLCASAANAQPAPTPPNPAHMSRAQLQAEITASRQRSQRGFVTAPRPAGCTSPESRQLDFWLGEWDVSFTGHEGVVAEGVQRSLDQGCAILEDFHTFSGIEGHGLFAYDPAMHKWRQSYVDTSGSYSTLRGEFENGAMTFDFVDTPSSLNGHVHIQRINADTVHLWSETQNPETHAWSILFDLTYHRRANTH